MVNTAGPWVTDALARLGVNTRARVRLVKGSHIVVPKLYDGDHAYIVQLADRRIVFAVPWQDGFTQVGTTDIAVDNPKDAQIDADEIARSEEHTSELQSLMRSSYAVFCLKKKKNYKTITYLNLLRRTHTMHIKKTYKTRHTIT